METNGSSAGEAEHARKTPRCGSLSIINFAILRRKLVSKSSKGNRKRGGIYSKTKSLPYE